MRKGDTKHDSLSEMHKFCLDRDEHCREEMIDLRELEFTVKNSKLSISLPGVGDMDMTPWSFKQVCGQFGANPRFTDLVSSVKPSVGVDIFNVLKGLITEQALANLYIQRNGNTVLRASTGRKYARLLDSTVLHTIIEHTDSTVLPAGHFAGNWGTSDVIENPESTGLYTSDRDSFVFIANQSDPIDYGGEKLNRGMIIWNSEVGSKVVGWMYFLYRFICGNHIIWGAEEVIRKTRRHVGNVEQFMEELPRHLEALCTRNPEFNKHIEEVCKRAMEMDFSKDEEKFCENLQKKGLTKKASTKVHSLAIKDSETTTGYNPYSFWGAVQGLTRFSQSKTFSDAKVEVDRVAGSLLHAVEEAI